MTDGRTDERTDICDCRVAFATEKNEASTMKELGNCFKLTVRRVCSLVGFVGWD